MRDYGNTYITYRLVLSDVLSKKGFPVVYHGVKGSEQHAKWSPSYLNIIEASVVRDHCVKLIGDLERKTCKHGAVFGSTCSHFCFPLRIPRGDWRPRILQSSGQGHSGVVEGGNFIGYPCELGRAVQKTGLM